MKQVIKVLVLLSLFPLLIGGGVFLFFILYAMPIQQEAAAKREAQDAANAATENLLDENAEALSQRVTRLIAWYDQNGNTVDTDSRNSDFMMNASGTLFLDVNELNHYQQVIDENSSLRSRDADSSVDADLRLVLSKGGIQSNAESVERLRKSLDRCLGDHAVFVKCEIVQTPVFETDNEAKETEYETGILQYSAIAVTVDPIKVVKTISGTVENSDEISIRYLDSDSPKQVAATAQRQLRTDLYDRVNQAILSKLILDASDSE